MESELAALKQQNHELTAQLASMQAENMLLHQKVQLLLKRLFGRKSEKLDRNQLELLLNVINTPGPEDDDDPTPPAPRRIERRRERKPRLPENLPTQDIIVDPDEVNAAPEDYKCIGEEVTEELDVIPVQYIKRRIIRRKYVSKLDRALPPIIAPLKPRLIEGGYASPGLVTDIVLKKYEDHLPLYRQERILADRHRIHLSRKTMADWVRVAADWLKPIYNHLRDDLRRSGYLQIDESPVRYCRAEGGGSGQGYLWAYYRPGMAGKSGGDVLYEWHTGRGAECLHDMLEDFAGTVQCDGYSAYTSYAKSRDDLELAGCWAHARRKFYEAHDEAPGLAGWILEQIKILYAIETHLRSSKAGPKLRQAVRSAQSRMVLNRLERLLHLKRTAHLPRGRMGEAISYALKFWVQLNRFCEDGRLEIDNNLVENAIRPTAIGKKNWLFFGAPDAGERSAVIYSLLATCRRYGIDCREYLCDVFTRLPSMKISEVAELTPAAWAAQRKAKAA